LQKVWVPLFEIQISKLFPIAHTEKFMQWNKVIFNYSYCIDPFVENSS
jgi:hypothetical protein